MAINSDKIILYSIIESRLKENPTIKINELKKYCEKEFRNLTGKFLVVSEETLENDLDNLKSLLEIPIKKSKITGGYYITDKEISFLSKIENSVEAYQLKFKYLFGETQNKNMFKHVSVKIQTKGWQHLLPISKAIKEKCYIQFKYREKDGKFLEIQILPMELNCLNLSWVVIGVGKKDGGLTTFALSNIFGGTIYKETVPVDQLPLTFLIKDPYNESLDKISEDRIRLQINSKDYHDVVEHPFHSNQKLKISDDKTVNIEFEDLVSEELIKRIMSYGNDIKILSPDSLTKSVANKNLKSFLSYLIKKRLTLPFYL